MAHVKVTKQVNAPLEKVWASWEDFGGVHSFHPHVKDSYVTEDSRVIGGVGCRRQCDMTDGKNWLREEITEYVPQKLIRMRIYDGTMPLKSAEGVLSLAPEGPGTTVTMEMTFTPKFGPLGLLMAPMMQMMFKKMLRELLESNARFVETGKAKAA